MPPPSPKNFLRLSALFFGHFLSKPLHWMTQTPIRVFLFHYLDEIDASKFEATILKIKDYYKIVDPNDILTTSGISVNNTETRPLAIITFDDGALSDYTIAAKILGKFDVRAIFFICPGLIEISNREEQQILIKKHIRPPRTIPCLMDWNQITELYRIGHSIGIHSHTHQRISTLVDSTLLEKEIALPIQTIKNRLDQNWEPKYFAYPFGTCHDICPTGLKIIGSYYKYCFSGVRGANNPRTNKMTIRRDMLDPLWNPSLLNYFIGGAADIFYWRARRILGRWAELAPKC